MKRLAASLPMIGLLLALWLVLNDSVSPGQIVLGLLIAIVLSLLAPILRPVRAHPRRPGLALRLLSHVAADILRSNYMVGRRILRGDAAGAGPGFLDIPLRIRDPHGLAVLACIVTFTPGTIWSRHDAERNLLTLHVLDLDDPDGLTRIIQDRYEGPLMEIFP
jgi:multicomponent K+:H+ antiporter subunit E